MRRSGKLRMRILTTLLIITLMMSGRASAGPPYLTDDPEPTELHHFEIFFFDAGTATRFGTGSAAGIDFNYGAAPDLQLNTVLPVGFNSPLRGPIAVNLGNIELAAKYRFLHQNGFGLDVSFYPRVFVPAGSNAVGAR